MYLLRAYLRYQGPSQSLWRTSMESGESVRRRQHTCFLVSTSLYFRRTVGVLRSHWPVTDGSRAHNITFEGGRCAVTTSSLLGSPGSFIETLYGTATQVFNIHPTSIAHYASLTQFHSVLRWLNRLVTIRFPLRILILHFKSHATDVLFFAVLLSSGFLSSPLSPTLSYFFVPPGHIFMK